MGSETRPTRRILNGEVDDERQRGAKGKRRRYFLAAFVRRAQDSALRRLHVHSLRQPEAAHRPSNPRLSLPVPAFMPLAEELKHPGDVYTGTSLSRSIVRAVKYGCVVEGLAHAA